MNRYDVQHKGLWVATLFAANIYDAHDLAKEMYGQGICTTCVDF